MYARVCRRFVIIVLFRKRMCNVRYKRRIVWQNHSNHIHRCCCCCRRRMASRSFVLLPACSLSLSLSVFLSQSHFFIRLHKTDWMACICAIRLYMLCLRLYQAMSGVIMILFHYFIFIESKQITNNNNKQT